MYCIINFLKHLHDNKQKQFFPLHNSSSTDLHHCNDDRNMATIFQLFLSDSSIIRTRNSLSTLARKETTMANFGNPHDPIIYKRGTLISDEL